MIIPINIKQGLVLSLTIALAIAFALSAIPTRAFDIKDGYDVHQTITKEALALGPVFINDKAVNSIVGGNVNADQPLITHKSDNVIHFNSAKMFVNNLGSGSIRFDQSNAFIQEQLDEAAEYARGNPKFLNPDYRDAREIAKALKQKLNQITSFVLNISDCGPIECSEAGKEIVKLQLDLAFILAPDKVPDNNNPIPLPSELLRQLSITISNEIPDRNDPHTLRGARFKQLSSKISNLSRLLRASNERGSRSYREALWQLRYEVRAHVARQNLGHAFHTIQDFFAHSNIVELLHDENPVCSVNRFSERVCSDEEISDGFLSIANLSSAPQKVKNFVAAIYDEASLGRPNLTRALSGDDLRRLETGYVGSFTSAELFEFRLHEAVCQPGEAARAGFNYCHWETDSVPGLHKDNSDHDNFVYAKTLATLISSIYWTKFLIKTEFVDPPPQIRLSELSVLEGNAPRNFQNIRLNFTGPLPADASLNYEFVTLNQAGRASAIPGQRCNTAGVDYVPDSGSVNVSRGRNFVEIPLLVCGDRDFEVPQKTLGLQLTQLRQFDPQQENLTLTVLIQNDDIDRDNTEINIPDEIFRVPDLMPSTGPIQNKPPIEPVTEPQVLPRMPKDITPSKNEKTKRN